MSQQRKTNCRHCGRNIIIMVYKSRKYVLNAVPIKISYKMKDGSLVGAEMQGQWRRWYAHQDHKPFCSGSKLKLNLSKPYKKEDVLRVIEEVGNYSLQISVWEKNFLKNIKNIASNGQEITEKQMKALIDVHRRATSE